MKIVSHDQPEQHPTLKMAHLEIQEVFRKYDVGGICQMFLPGHTEFVMNISPSFSVVSLNAVNHLTITPPLVDPENEAASKQRIVDTINMLFNLRNHMMKPIMALGQAEAAVRTHFGMEAPKKPGAPIPPQGMNGQHN